MSNDKIYIDGSDELPKKEKSKVEIDFTYFEKKGAREFSLKLKENREKATVAMKDFVSKLGTEAKETHNASKIFAKYVKVGKLTAEEEKELKEQVYDLFKMMGIGIPFMLIPGSTLIIPFLTKVAEKRGINLLPSAFSSNKEILEELEENKDKTAEEEE